MAYTLGELAERVGGTVRGDASLQLTGASPPATAATGEITLIDGPTKLKSLRGCPAAAVIVPHGVDAPLPSIAVDEPHAAFTKIILLFRPPRGRRHVGISPQAIISPSARLAPNVQVHPLAVIGDDVEIGAGSVVHSGAVVMAGSRLAEGVVVFPNAVLYENTVVGPRSIIHAGVVLGAHGFGYRTVDGRHCPTGQLGYVEIGADVEIGSNSTIDRGTYGPTRIGDGTKIDDLVMIGHNCVIGRHNLLCGQSGIAGSSSTGAYVVMAGQSGVCDHIHVHDRAVLCAKAGVTRELEAGETVFGTPARPVREHLVQLALTAKLPELFQQVRELRRQVAALQNHWSGDADGGAESNVADDDANGRAEAA